MISHLRHKSPFVKQIVSFDILTPEGEQGYNEFLSKDYTIASTKQQKLDGIEAVIAYNNKTGEPTVVSPAVPDQLYVIVTYYIHKNALKEQLDNAIKPELNVLLKLPIATTERNERTSRATPSKQKRESSTDSQRRSKKPF